MGGWGGGVRDVAALEAYWGMGWPLWRKDKKMGTGDGG